jgi:hypothetical protein
MVPSHLGGKKRLRDRKESRSRRWTRAATGRSCSRGRLPAAASRVPAAASGLPAAASGLPATAARLCASTGLCSATGLSSAAVLRTVFRLWPVLGMARRLVPALVNLTRLSANDPARRPRNAWRNDIMHRTSNIATYNGGRERAPPIAALNLSWSRRGTYARCDEISAPV